MGKLITALLIMGLVSFGIALADDMDNDRVIREEHVTRAAQSGSSTSSDSHVSAKPSNSEPGANLHATQNNSSTREDRDVPEVEHAQDFLDERAQMADRSHPDTLGLDSLGLYFGLGENFIESANSLIEQRQAGYSEHGNYPVFSRLSDGPLGDLSVSNADQASHNHQHDQDSASDDSHGGLADHDINRRGADHDYFYD